MATPPVSMVDLDFWTNTGGSVYDNFNKDPSIRFTDVELIALQTVLGQMIPAANACVVANVAGGALEHSLLPWGQDYNGSVQQYCKTELSFDEAIKALEDSDPKFAAFVRLKGGVATAAETASAHAQYIQDTMKVVSKEGDIVVTVAKDTGDVVQGTVKGATGILELAPLFVGLIIIGVLVAVVVIAKNSSLKDLKP